MYIYCFILFYIYSFIIVSLFTLEKKMEKIQIKQMQWLFVITPIIWLCFFPILQCLKNGKMEKIGKNNINVYILTTYCNFKPAIKTRYWSNAGLWCLLWWGIFQKNNMRG